MTFEQTVNELKSSILETNAKHAGLFSFEMISDIVKATKITTKKYYKIGDLENAGKCIRFMAAYIKVRNELF